MLEIKGLSVTYDEGKRALDGVTFSLSPGESVALIGANGAGKTSMLLALVGVLSPTFEVFAVDGAAYAKDTLRDIRGRIGLAFQNPDDQLFMPDLFEDCAFGPRNLGIPEAQVHARVLETLTTLGIAHLARRSPLKMSGGEKRLAAMATALVMAPRYILFDEPTAFLDPRARRALCRTLAALPQGKLIATHDLAFAAETCSRVLLLQEGKLVADGDASLLRDEARLLSVGL